MASLHFPLLSSFLHLLAVLPRPSPFSLSPVLPAGGALCSWEQVSTGLLHFYIVHHESWWRIAASLWSLHIAVNMQQKLITKYCILINALGALQFWSPKNYILETKYGKMYQNFNILKPFYTAFGHLFPMKKSGRGQLLERGDLLE